MNAFRFGIDRQGGSAFLLVLLEFLHLRFFVLAFDEALVGVVQVVVAVLELPVFPLHVGDRLLEHGDHLALVLGRLHFLLLRLQRLVLLLELGILVDELVGLLPLEGVEVLHLLDKLFLAAFGLFLQGAHLLFHKVLQHGEPFLQGAEPFCQGDIDFGARRGGILGLRLLSALSQPHPVAVLEHLLHEQGVDDLQLVGKAVHQGRIAEDVDCPGYPAARLEDEVHGLGGEEIGPAPGFFQAVGYVRAGLFPGERRDVVGHADALVELRHVPGLEPLPDLGLAHEDDLQKQLVVALQVRDHPDLFERLAGEVLRLVHDEERPLAGGIAVDEAAVQPVQGARLAFAVLELELAEDHVDKLQWRHVRVEHHRRFKLGLDLPEHVLDERGLPRAHLAREEDEPDPLHEAVFEVGERGFVPRAQVEEIRIGDNLEGFYV